MLPVEARSWIATQRGDLAEVCALRSSQGEVWRVTLTDAAQVAVKRASRAAIDRECWGLALARTMGSVPTLLSRPAPELVVLTWHDGVPSVGAQTVRLAGVWLRALHECEGTFCDPLPVPDAIGRRRDAWLERARPHLSAPVRARLLETIEPGVFTGLKRTACHRDFTPSNWLWSDALTVIDFGQARPDLPLWDLVKLEAETFHEHPDLRSTFFEGYGSLDAQDEVRLGQLVLLHGLQTAVWGDSHGDAAFSSLGRQILERRLT